MNGPPVTLVGDGALVPCLDGQERPYVSFDAAASTPRSPRCLARVEQFVPWYSSVHRGAGYKSQLATAAYEDAREAALAFAGRDGRDDVAIICRNTTEALNHLAYRLRLEAADVVVTTVVEHHANLLPWSRLATCRYVECGRDGTFDLADVEAALDRSPRPRLLAVTGGLEHHRMAAAARPRSSALRTAAASPSSSTLPSSPRIGRLPATPTSSPGADTRCTRPSAPASSSGLGDLHRRRPFLAGRRGGRPRRPRRGRLDRPA